MYFIKDDRNVLDCLVGLAPGIDSTQLHLMCEHQGEIHKVNEAKGCILKLANDTFLKICPFAVWGLRIFTIMLKVGGQVGVNLGTMVPNLEKMIFERLTHIPDVTLNLGANFTQFE
jgi:hypothetical protein